MNHGWVIAPMRYRLMTEFACLTAELPGPKTKIKYKIEAPGVTAMRHKLKH
jgi:hypothetical protein